jgi:predicted ATP-grasp superfamily ATP-dependent carboligase
MHSVSRNHKEPFAVVVSIDSMPGLQTARILADKKIPVIAIAKDAKHHSCRTNVCEEIIITDTESDKLIKKLIEIGPTFNSKAVLFPCQDTDVLLVSRHRAKLEHWYHIALPANETVEMLMDKMRFHEFAKKNSFPVPQTYIINSDGELEKAIQRLKYPCLLKPTIRTPEWIAHSEIKAFKLLNKETLLSTYNQHKDFAESFVLQQWLEGDDSNLYSMNCYFDRKSTPLVTFIARKIRQWPPRTGQSCLGEECRNDEVLRVSLDVFKKVNYVGLGYLEMKYDLLSKKHYIIEPNIGRPTGRSAIAEAGGVEILYTKYCDLTEKALPQNQVQKYNGVKWIHILRDLQSAFFYQREGQLTIRDWFKSVRGKKAYAIFSWRDPMPFVSATWAGFQEIIQSNHKN